jgi:hypothetical protein
VHVSQRKMLGILGEAVCTPEVTKSALGSSMPRDLRQTDSIFADVDHIKRKPKELLTFEATLKERIDEVSHEIVAFTSEDRKIMADILVD